MLLDFIKDKNKFIHFVGIGGVSMSGLAEILLKKGYKVSGSDMNSSETTDKLSKLGAKIFIEHNENNIKDASLVVYTAAISKNNPELKKASDMKIHCMDRAEFLGLLMKGHKFNIAISGTHGKTTTTSMASHIALKANLDPTILVGGNLDIIDGNVRTGNSDYFITEACEYKASFLKFYPYIGVILNIDADHLDYYKDIDDIQNTFSKFAKLIPENGYLVANLDDKRMNKIIDSVKCSVVTFGIEKGNIQAKNIKFNTKGCPSFDVLNGKEKIMSINLKVPGKHNILNSLASICVSIILNINPKYIAKGLESFYGTHRRFEFKGTQNGITVIDDYAHHPTEIKATLSAASNYPHKKIFCVFQPHTYSRTISLFKEFTECFTGVDELILADIYAAREKDNGKVSSDSLGVAIRKNNQKCFNFHKFEDIVSHLKSSMSKGDVLLTVGAGDVYKIGEMFLKK